MIEAFRQRPGTETCYRIRLRDVEIVSWPVDDMTARRRRNLIAAALEGETSSAAIIGRLILAGVTELSIETQDGTRRITAQPTTAAGRWRLDLADDGRVAARWIPKEEQ